MGFRFFKGLDVPVFHGFRMFGSQDFIGCRTFGFSDIDLGSSCLFRILVFFGIGWTWFFGSDRFRLLIQRWKNVMGWGNLFDKGGVWPDESGICPTNGSGG
jgi:hypothetical protein